MSETESEIKNVNDKTPEHEIREYRNIWAGSAYSGDGATGMHNGLELALSLLEGRTPQYLAYPEIRADILLKRLIDAAKREKPNDRSERDRYIAIFITELEKAQAFYFYHCGITLSPSDPT